MVGHLKKAAPAAKRFGGFAFFVVLRNKRKTQISATVVTKLPADRSMISTRGFR